MHPGTVLPRFSPRGLRFSPGGLRFSNTCLKGGCFFFLFKFSASLMQLSTTRYYIAVEEKFLGFVLIDKLACTELHGSGSFVKHIDPFCATNRHDLTAIRSAHTANINFRHL